jgi:hypothetical protein
VSRRTVLIIGTVLFVLAMIGVRINPRPHEATEAVAERPAFVRECDPGGLSSVRPHEPTARDAVLGPVIIGAFRDSFERARADEVFSPRPGLFVLKAPVVFEGEGEVTIGVPPELRGVLGLDYDPAGGDVDTVAEADSSVFFRACPEPQGATGYPGALLYSGRWPACVRLTARVGEARPTAHALSLGAGRCPRRG